MTEDTRTIPCNQCGEVPTIKRGVATGRLYATCECGSIGIKVAGDPPGEWV